MRIKTVIIAKNAFEVILLREKYSSLQIFALIFVTVSAPILPFFSDICAYFGKTSAYFSVFGGMVLGALLIFLYLSAGERCKGAPLEYIKNSYGMGALYIYKISFSLFYLSVAALSVSRFTLFMSKAFASMPKSAIYKAFLCLLGAYFSSGKMRCSARFSVFSSAFAAVGSAVCASMLFFGGDRRNLMPFFRFDARDFILCAIIVAALFFTASYVIFIKPPEKKRGKAAVSALSSFAAARYLLLIPIGVFSVLGPDWALSSSNSLSEAFKSFFAMFFTFPAKIDVIFVFFYSMLFVCALSNIFCAMQLAFENAKKNMRLLLFALSAPLVFAASFVPDTWLIFAALPLGIISSALFPAFMLIKRRR